MNITQPFYKIVALRASFLQRARREGIDELGQPVEASLAEGGEPLRDALRRAAPGEAILLASYCPFELAGPFREYGPVYLLAGGAPEPVPERLPAGAPGSYFGAPFVLRAYSAAERIVGAVLCAPHESETQLAALLARAEVAFVLARFAAYGCYGCRIERAGPAQG
ncbi:MAG: DUF1203 domain-containing protein [Pseudomonadota bacterium]